MKRSVVSVFINLRCADSVCLHSYGLRVCFKKLTLGCWKTLRYFETFIGCCPSTLPSGCKKWAWWWHWFATMKPLHCFSFQCTFLILFCILHLKLKSTPTNQYQHLHCIDLNSHQKTKTHHFTESRDQSRKVYMNLFSINSEINWHGIVTTLHSLWMNFFFSALLENIVFCK